jgi:RNA-binding protein YlmH
MFKNFGEETTKYIDEKKLLEAKINDKYIFATSKNKITNTDFLNMAEKSIAEKFLKDKSIQNYVFFGGNGDDSDRSILIFYPDKFTIEMVEKNYNKILSYIRIKLPKNLAYEHKIYLSGIMKLGIKREKIGDILVRENGADIIVLNEVAEFVKNNLQNLTRFKSANFDIINIDNVEPQKKEFENVSVIVSSMRLDNFVSEIARCSRSKALEIIEAQRVFVNYSLETKFSKKINIGDIINVRGKGKFIVGEINHVTKSDKLVVNMKKPV